MQRGRNRRSISLSREEIEKFPTVFPLLATRLRVALSTVLLSRLDSVLSPVSKTNPQEALSNSTQLEERGGLGRTT